MAIVSALYRRVKRSMSIHLSPLLSPSFPWDMACLRLPEELVLLADAMDCTMLSVKATGREINLILPCLYLWKSLNAMMAGSGLTSPESLQADGLRITDVQHINEA